MKEFLDRNFLLKGRSAKILFHDYADEMPIIDYHCHIDPAEIYENKRFEDLSEAWLGGDHYKWRLMRANGVGERYITGGASGWEKFRAFAEVLPRAVGNPVYHWAHLELRRYFGCEVPLGPDNARKIWDSCNEMLASDADLRVRGIINKMRVEAIVTTDDPADSLEWHRKLAADESFGTKVLPGWRPSLALDVESPGFAEYVKRLGEAAEVDIGSYGGFKAALLERMEYFNAQGCRSCDHGIRKVVYMPAAEERLNGIFEKRLRGLCLTEDEAEQFRYGLLAFFAREYARLGWVMELHLGVLRNVNSIMFDKLGPDTGYDCADASSGISGLAGFLDDLDKNRALPKTLIFSVEPADNMVINSLAGCFAEEGVKGKVQQGCAWWFNDTLSGMEQQMTCFAETGVLGNFVGMLTDSRSFLSYTRHEYFRRLLCGMLGKWADSGLYPADMSNLGEIVRDICYNNAKRYFGL